MVPRVYGLSAAALAASLLTLPSLLPPTAHPHRWPCPLSSTPGSLHPWVLQELFPLLHQLFLQISAPCSDSGLSSDTISATISKAAAPACDPHPVPVF